MNINMLYRQFYDQSGTDLMIGGVETYITNLIKLFIENGHKVFVYQFANKPFKNYYLGATVIGVCPHNKLERMYKNRIRAMIKESYKYSNPEKDILIFCTENDILPSKYKRVLAIQHGIGWDVHNSYKLKGIIMCKYWIDNSKRAFSEHRQYKHISTLICVDYNYVNWYRTCINDDGLKYKVIPNFSTVPSFRKRENNDRVSIIFARRFQVYRGTRIFANAIADLMEENDNIKVTIAGDGPEEKYLQSALSRFKNVEFIRFMPEESVRIHSDYDIAVVPSTASEGTSLSLIEAMAAGCAVISTDIGGLTNIIIDGHNGKIVRPNSRELLIALKELIEDIELRERLAQNGYNTVVDSFNHNEWSRKWIDTIHDLE